MATPTPPEKQLINILYIMMVVFGVGVAAIAYTNYRSGDLDFLGYVGTASGNQISKTFEKWTEPSEVMEHYVQRFGAKPPAGIKLAYACGRWVVAEKNYKMWCVKGTLDDLQKFARLHNCSACPSTDPTFEPGANGFASVMPPKWREMKLYRSMTVRNGRDVRFYIDEERNRGYLTDQVAASIVSAD